MDFSGAGAAERAAIISADAILLIHALYVAAAVLPVPLVWLARRREPRRGFLAFFLRPAFKRVHLTMVGLVAVEAIIGVDCPLTVWEASLRRRAGQAVVDQSFIEKWVSRVLFHDFEPWVFTVAYIAFAGLVAWLHYGPKSKRS